ncbi:MAG TPA: DUF1272 domain-containing protein [Candidatus Dormibacteraeota bacterium]
MKTSCEQCGRQLKANEEARVCSYDCTFCPACATGMSNVCPNCGGQLRPRPTRL